MEAVGTKLIDWVKGEKEMRKVSVLHINKREFEKERTKGKRERKSLFNCQYF